MFSLHDKPARLCDGIGRREVLRIGGLGLAGLSLPSLLAAREETAAGIPAGDATFGRAKNIIFLYLAGGPPQHETFDPKPDAPTEIRGAFQPISTNIPGIQFCELLPRTACIADKLAVVRSIATDDNTHSSSGHWVLTGYKYVGPNPRTIQPSDWPYFGSIVKKYKPSDALPPLSTVWLPDILRLNESVTPAGQSGGILGRQWDPERFVGDPSRPDYSVEGLQLTDVDHMRLRLRETMLNQVNRHLDKFARNKAVRLYDQYHTQAFDLLTSGKAREAFAIQREPDKIRERYGKNRWGQCVLLARRLVEAGVRLVHVQWPREPGDNAVDNPLWDTHAQNADRVEDVLCPQFDVGFTALIEDLDQRGLLDETLVVAIGEFGRTPKINAKGGRDHWGPVFSFAMAGAGISSGQVFGASDSKGGYPARDRVEPGHLTATIFHLLGVNPKGSFIDRDSRPHRLTQREPIYQILGTAPATRERTTSTGDIARVPPFDEKRILTNTKFEDKVSLKPVDAPSRPKGWKATPLADNKEAGPLTVQQHGGQIVIKLNLAGDSAGKVDNGALAMLAQEVRSPFAGTYRLTLRVRGEASLREFYEKTLLKHFTCKLSLIEFTDRDKNPLKRKELAAIKVTPALADDRQSFEKIELTKEFVNPKPGSNFSFGIGLGVAVTVEKTTGAKIAADKNAGHAQLTIDAVDLEFIGKPRNETVKV